MAKVEGGIFGIYGGFGIGKTLLAVIMILQDLSNGEIVFTNIRLNRNLIPNPHNYYFFEDFSDFVEILKISGLFAIKFSEENEKRIKEGLPPLPRNFRPKFKIYFDEMGIFANSSSWKELGKEYGEVMRDFILQCRKLFASIYCIEQKPNLLFKELRQHINYWYTYESYGHFGDYLGWIVQQELNIDTWAVDIRKVLKIDNEGQSYTIDIPLSYTYKTVFFRYRFYKYYDDMYLNMQYTIEFSTNYLKNSGFLENLQNNKINNKFLVQSKKYYEYYTKDIMIVIEDNQSYSEVVKVALLRSYRIFYIYAKRKYNEISKYIRRITLVSLFPTFVTFFSKSKKK